MIEDVDLKRFKCGASLIPNVTRGEGVDEQTSVGTED